MKTVKNRNFLNAAVAIAMTMGAWLPTAATAADEPMKPMKGGEHQMMMPGVDAEATEGMMTESNMMERCQAMKEQKEKMMADMKAQDAELAVQVAKMNSAPENKKLDMMAAVVTKMVEQQTAMNARKAKMEEAMMKHMMQHMQMGKESMSQCPMMTGMMKTDGKSIGDREEK